MMLLDQKVVLAKKCYSSEPVYRTGFLLQWVFSGVIGNADIDKSNFAAELPKIGGASLHHDLL